MFEPLLQGASYLLDPTLLLFVLLGVILAQIVSIIPGLGGAFLLAVILPFTFGMDPIVAIAVLIGATVTDGTGNTVTSIVFGVPGSPTGVASLFDGHPMAKQGLAGRAIGAGVGACAVGAVIGAVALAVMIPIVRPIVLAIGPAEFFVLIVVALYAIAYVREESLLKGLVAAGLGLALSFVGMEAGSGVPRFTFGELYLWEGLQLVPFLIGLFAVAEMIDLLRRRGRIAEREIDTELGGGWEGVKDVFRHFRATWTSSWVGVGVGILPGLGGSAAQFMSYAAVARTSKTKGLPPFGKGNIEGVIAADAGTVSKDGGALVPTLAFGIPGSSSMAILLAAFISLGVDPGPNMLEGNLDIVWMIVIVLILANILATALILLFTKPFAKLTYVRASMIAPAVLVISLFGAYTTTQHVGDIFTVLGVGVLGYFMKKYGYSRATLVIGFVLGPLLEHQFQLSLQLFGPAFLLVEPIATALSAALLASIAWSLIRAKRRARREATGASRESTFAGSSTGGSLRRTLRRVLDRIL